MWTGYFPSLARDVPHAAIYFSVYETAKYIQFRLRFGVHPAAAGDGTSTTTKKQRLNTANHLLSGATAGGIASALTIPLDVVKTRLQTQATLPLEERRFHGIFSTLKTIYREEGMTGLTRGLGPRLAYVIPASSVTFACYEQYKKLLKVS